MALPNLIKNDSLAVKFEVEEPIMSDKFENVTIVKKANIYFDGKVTSRNILFADGTRKTLGFMLPGDYEFSTGAREIMELLNGEMNILLPGHNEWQIFKAGESFEIPANSSFKLKINVPVDYCCSYG
jgi:purine/pyrimidine-nucleoside phosphorylase